MPGHLIKLIKEIFHFHLPDKSSFGSRVTWSFCLAQTTLAATAYT